MAADNDPLLSVQMKEGPVDKIVVGSSAARVLVSLLVRSGEKGNRIVQGHG